MSDLALRRSSSLPNVALALGIAAFVIYWGLGLATDSWGWLVGAGLGVIAVIVGVAARKDADASDRRRATIGLVIGAIPVVWFLGYLLVDWLA